MFFYELIQFQEEPLCGLHWVPTGLTDALLFTLTRLPAHCKYTQEYITSQ